MASDFDVFNRTSPFLLYRQSSPTSGHYGANDQWVAPTNPTPAPQIQGHLSVIDRMGRESQYVASQAGVLEQGSMRFYTETLMEKGDIVEAVQEASVVYRYRVLGLVRAHRFLAKMLGKPTRYEYDVREMPR